MLTNTEAQVVDLLQYLDTHEATYYEIERHIAGNHGSPRGTYYLIGLARYKFGDDIVLCKYDYRRGEYIYRTARSAGESLTYVVRRTSTIRNSAINQTHLLDRVAAKFPGDEPAKVASNQANLVGAIHLLDGVTT